jgi:hypothetical protein
MEREDVHKPSDGKLEARRSRTPAAIPGRLSAPTSKSVQRNLRDLPTVNAQIHEARCA